MKPKRPIILYEGEKFTIECAIRKGGSSESQDFLDSMSIADKAKIIKVIKRLANVGRIINTEQFKKVEGKIWEFKYYQTRIFMYYCARQRVVLTNGFYKKGDKIPKEEIKRANQIMNEYNEIKGGMEP